VETTMTIAESASAVASPAHSLCLERSDRHGSWAPRRRSGRLTLDFAVELYGQERNGRIFHEETRTLVVSVYGALISLAADVELDQVIVLTCRDRQEMRCRVVYREETMNGEVHVGIAFMAYSPSFWGVSFPTDN
jgi:hypothetical protein